MKQQNRILVLDPRGAAAFRIESALAHQGFEVDSCTQPKNVTQRLSQQQYALVLLPLEDHNNATAMEQTLQPFCQTERMNETPPLLLLLNSPAPSMQLFQTLWKSCRVDFLPFNIDATLLALKCHLMIRQDPTPKSTELPEGINSAIPRLQSLSRREEEILNLVGRGLSNREISTELILSEHSVRTHLYHIYAKLGIKRRSQAVLIDMYRRHGA